ncbi:MAG: hypothetical protein J0H65_08925, partial [Rhizobiales bacterium]|nr:hypothetical protein [Hyphomicrobiales bacterium]
NLGRIQQQIISLIRYSQFGHKLVLLARTSRAAVRNIAISLKIIIIIIQLFSSFFGSWAAKTRLIGCTRTDAATSPRQAIFVAN